MPALSATETLVALDKKSLSCRELMSETLSQIRNINSSVNAICTLIDEEKALQLAAEADSEREQKKNGLGSLHGLPIAIKDSTATKGIRTTLGSPIFTDHIPDYDALIVERIKSSGAIIIGKTNIPEFATGCNTFNPIFGATRNPWDLTKTVGGSSGGAAAALSTEMISIADGSDMGGSLRNPAAFCGVVGFRPSIGRVPLWPTEMAWHARLATEGSMARNVTDCSLLLSALVGFDSRDPLAIHSDPEIFRKPLKREFSRVKVGWTPDLGILPVENEIVSACEGTLTIWEQCGLQVVDCAPDLSGAMDAFKVLRASYFAQFGGALLEKYRDQMKQTVIENIEEGLSLTSKDVAQADAVRTEMYARIIEFFEGHEYLILPSTQVSPFDVGKEWVREINGQELGSYLDWMSICCIISLFGLPALSLPCGFDSQGLPVGLQIVGKPRGDLDVLQAAFAIERALKLDTRPTLL